MHDARISLSDLDTVRSILFEEGADLKEESSDAGRVVERWVLVEDTVDLETVEDRFFVEFKSQTKEGLERLLAIFGVDQEEIIKKPQS